MRIVYCGSSGPLSLLPLQALLSAGHSIVAVMVDMPWISSPHRIDVPVLIENDDSVAALAALHQVPVLAWSQSPETNRNAVGEFEPDVLLVSCFAKRLPEALLSLPRIGCFNLHPSWLPAYRGPAPVFWQFRDGLTALGITLHRMTSRLDAGPVLAQKQVVMPDGISERDANLLLAQAAGDLLVPALQQLAQGLVREAVQDEGQATYRGFPSATDFHVSACWSARRLYNFVRATCDRGIPCTCEVEGRVYQIAQALTYQPSGTAGLQPDGEELVLPCNPGVVRLRLWTETG
ncbi:MAG: formyltransferase family protein [Thiogranum sp.]|nr:formyltransferase family protein [Thiogranum sp.]